MPREPPCSPRVCVAEAVEAVGTGGERLPGTVGEALGLGQQRGTHRHARCGQALRLVTCLALVTAPVTRLTLHL